MYKFEYISSAEILFNTMKHSIILEKKLQMAKQFTNVETICNVETIYKC